MFPIPHVLVSIRANEFSFATHPSPHHTPRVDSTLDRDCSVRSVRMETSMPTVSNWLNRSPTTTLPSDCHCARPYPSRAVSYGPFEAIPRREGRETSILFAFSIPSRVPFRRRKTPWDIATMAAVARRSRHQPHPAPSPIIREPQKLQSRASLAFFLCVTI